MRNLSEMTVNEIKEMVFELYSDEKAKEILSLSMDQVISILEADEACIAAEESIPATRHIPSRKKKANRTKGNSKSTVKYKKSRSKKWKEETRTNTSREDTVNRSYLNKASKGYIKLQPHVKQNSKKDSKNS